MDPQVNWVQTEPLMTSTELDQYNQDCVKKLVYQMFDQLTSGKNITDYGSVQYKYLELWGMIDIDDYKKFIPQATLIDRAEVNCGFKMVKPLQKKENIMAIAKFLCVKELYNEVWRQGLHISSLFQNHGDYV